MLLIDDYDVLAAAGTALLAPLLPHQAAAGDSGMHMVMALLNRPVEHVQTAYVGPTEARAP